MAIEKPAEMQGAAFEAGLVERILDDVGDKPGNLPLLEFTLTLLVGAADRRLADPHALRSHGQRRGRAGNLRRPGVRRA